MTRRAVMGRAGGCPAWVGFVDEKFGALVTVDDSGLGDLLVVTEWVIV